jgi:hypothetical protein
MATNSQVAHAWANKTGKHRRGSNFFYEDDTIYSYGGHFPIARHMDGAVLFTTEGYGNSTSKHISHTSNACSHLKVFRVVDVTAARTSSSKLGWLQGHKWNVQDYLRRIDEGYGSASRSIKHGEWKYLYADGLVTELKAYAKHFKLGRTFVENHIPSPEIREKVMARCNAYNARKDERNREWLEKRRAEAAVLDEANREQMERWTRWESGVRKVHTTKVYLRATEEKLDGKRIVETSHGADVPYDSARMLYQFASTRRKSGDDWQGRGTQARRVGDFSLNTINSEGITVGCHRIGWEEIDRLAEVEGWQGV